MKTLLIIKYHSIKKNKSDPQNATPDPRESHEATKKERDETEKIFGERQDKYH